MATRADNSESPEPDSVTTVKAEGHRSTLSYAQKRRLGPGEALLQLLRQNRRPFATFTLLAVLLGLGVWAGYHSTCITVSTEGTPAWAQIGERKHDLAKRSWFFCWSDSKQENCLLLNMSTGGDTYIMEPGLHPWLRLIPKDPKMRCMRLQQRRRWYGFEVTSSWKRMDVDGDDDD